MLTKSQIQKVNAYYVVYKLGILSAIMMIVHSVVYIPTAVIIRIAQDFEGSISLFELVYDFFAGGYQTLFGLMILIKFLGMTEDKSWKKMEKSLDITEKIKFDKTIDRFKLIANKGEFVLDDKLVKILTIAIILSATILSMIGIAFDILICL